MKRHQLSRSLHWSLENIATSKRETRGALRISRSLDRKTTKSKNSSSREQIVHRYKATDVLQCIVCESPIKSPKMMKCRHVFCLQCFKNRLVISRKKDAGSICPVCNIAVIDVKDRKKESTKNSVSFAPLPLKLRDEKCRVCGEICESKCRHCKRRFCNVCWTGHINDLKEELNNINRDLETSATSFEGRINNFVSKANKTKEFIIRDIEAKIIELHSRKENQIKKVENIIAAGETSVEDIRQRMYKTQTEIKEQKEISYDVLPNNNEKVKTFLHLQQKAAEVMAAIAIWESELNNVEMGLGKINKASLVREKTKSRSKRKTSTPKVIVDRHTMQRPSALAIDSWRDNIIATCPGSGQIIILDRQFKPVRKIRHQEMVVPQGVAFLQERDEIYVTDKWKHCIFVFDHMGEFIRRMCSKGQGESQLRSPEGIVFHSERSAFYVADTGNNRVQILEQDGTYVDSIGPKSKQTKGAVRFRKIGPSHLNQPTDVAVTTTRVAVADSGNHKIKIFDHDGQILQVIGAMGTGKGLFRSPEVLRIDKKGNIIVGDAGNGRVQIFSSDGEFLRFLGAKRSWGHKFGWVSGLLVTNNSDILVSDSKNNLIYLF